MIPPGQHGQGIVEVLLFTYHLTLLFLYHRTKYFVTDSERHGEKRLLASDTTYRGGQD
jgi:hypothetical protein